MIVFCVLCSGASLAEPREDALLEQASASLRKAAQFFRSQVALHGGYQYVYSEDLKRSVGEGRGSAASVTVQPPGTPSVGLAYLEAFEATGDEYYLEAARDVAICLLRGQKRSGGWDYRIEFDPEMRRQIAYRTEPEGPQRQNVTNLDDNTTQTALRFLMRMDRAFDFKDVRIHEAVRYALTALLEAQYPNGAWPQRYDHFPEPEKFPVKPAGFPTQWSRTWPQVDYRPYYTFNDNTILDTIRTLFEAARIYDEEEYRKAAVKGADFILLARMPDPQPAWAQQYDFDMHPAWARRFEPPAVSGRESQDILLTLLEVYQETGDPKYLRPIPSAIRYLRRSLLPDGRLARFYELQTNKPLYFTTDYRLTYSDAGVPTHYAFKIESRLDQIETEYRRLQTIDSPEPPGSLRLKHQEAPTPGLKAQTREVIAALDEDGRWLDEGPLPGDSPDQSPGRVISSSTFVGNFGILCRYLRAAGRPPSGNRSVP